MPGIHANDDILTVRICKINSSCSRINRRKVCILPGRIKADLLSIAVKSRCAGQWFLLSCGFRNRCVGGISRRRFIYSFIFRIWGDRKIILELCAVSVRDLCCILPHPVRQQHRRTAQDNRKNGFLKFNLLYDKYYCSYCIIITFQIGEIQIKLRFQKGKYNVKKIKEIAESIWLR